MLGAAILLMVAGIHTFAPRLAVIWLASIAAATPLAICTPFGTWPLRCWIFAGALALSAWVFLRIDAIVKRGDVAALSASVLLAASWASITVNTLHAYLSQNAESSNAAALVVVLLYWALIVGVLVCSGITIFRSH